MTNIIDLNTPPPNHKYKVSIDREETKGERFVRLSKDLVLFMFAIALVALCIWICYDTLQNDNASADAKQFAMSIISATATGMVTYLVQKK